MEFHCFIVFCLLSLLFAVWGALVRDGACVQKDTLFTLAFVRLFLARLNSRIAIECATADLSSRTRCRRHG
jgi:hypothetical protein